MSIRNETNVTKCQMVESLITKQANAKKFYQLGCCWLKVTENSDSAGLNNRKKNFFLYNKP